MQNQYPEEPPTQPEERSQAGPDVRDHGPPRLAPDRPLPAYAYVPRSGLPHPTADQEGHAYGRRPEEPARFDPARWASSPSYIFGVDLFNDRFFWEAHEAWETLWHALGRRGAAADMLKGLIKLAAAGVKHREGVPAGTRTHACRAAQLWRDVALTAEAQTGRMLGLRLDDLIALADRISQEGWPDEPVWLIPVEEEKS